MTTTVLRGKTGALLRIPTGAVRRSPDAGVPATYFAAFFIDESSTYVWGGEMWGTDVARYTAALDVLRGQHREHIAITALIAVVPDPFVDPLLPEGELYPPGVVPPGTTVPPVLARNPSLLEIKNAFFPYQEAPNEELNPTHWVIDNSSSMFSTTLDPGRIEYIASVLEPGAYTQLEYRDERWLAWVAEYLEGLAE